MCLFSEVFLVKTCPHCSHFRVSVIADASAVLYTSPIPTSEDIGLGVGMDPDHLLAI